MSGTAALTTPGAQVPVPANARPAITDERERSSLDGRGSVRGGSGSDHAAAGRRWPRRIGGFEPPQTEPGHPAQRVADSISGASASDEIERTLTSWWKDLLGVENIGVHDNFFDLGGHSLLGLRLLAKIEREFQQSICSLCAV